jgi:pyridoxine 5-phosphate synthase
MTTALGNDLILGAGTAPATRLSVNLNKVALLRNARLTGEPSVVSAAETALDAGAHGITVHPRPGGRHIRPRDVHDLAAYLRNRGGAEFNVEGNPFPEFLALMRAARPDQCTLVPDSVDAATSDHGWNPKEHGSPLADIVAELRELGIRVSLFMDFDSEQWQLAKDLGADRVELYTEPYASAYARGDFQAILSAFALAARKAQAAGLGVNAGHDLNLKNLGAFCSIPGILEVSIGHALVGDALREGLAAAVRAYLNVLSGPGNS